MKTSDVPFIENPDTRCVPAVIAMILAYFMPEQPFTSEEVEKLCGYKKGHGTWKALSMLNLAKLGFQVRWIEDFDNERFAKDPKAYLRSILDDEAYKSQIANTNLEEEAERTQSYLASGLPFEKRPATDDEIKQFIDDGWLVHLEVNARVLSGKKGYDGHSILVVGYDDDNVTIHHPDGDSGNVANQKVSWELLHKAWKDFGGSYSLYAFKK
jgi:hypothetical protein